MPQASGTDRDAKPDPIALEIDRLAALVESKGREIGLPCVAASADIGSPAPIRDSNGRPYAGALFKWVDPDLRYWEDRGFALRSYFIHAVRICSEPMFYSHGRLATWRQTHVLDALNGQGPAERFSVGAAIISPTYLPGGVIGAVVWATADADFAIEPVFREHIAHLQALAMHFIGADHERTVRSAAISPPLLTRREIQCLKWGAAGKTDSEISIIMGISAPTVRFHMTNAARKLDVVGRSQAIYRAATLGYVGMGPSRS
ncbi:helix-turn-helix transcriptional regulator [Vitreimonas flagellata]|uniref:helix-turn-helix transcriptional regulator n=1 Tax=Vitreimonas flagellata TaxID=2560861 RepID=UPI0010756ACA|nr:LuxR C-terminal-related transcriptional regulator [Vitreimonas flagellata]